MWAVLCAQVQEASYKRAFKVDQRISISELARPGLNEIDKLKNILVFNNNSGPLTDEVEKVGNNNMEVWAKNVRTAQNHTGTIITNMKQ